MIVFSAPQPRSQLYTTIAAYARATSVLLGLGHEGGGIRRLENALEARHPGYRAIAVPMARVGVYLTLKHTIRKGQKVILSPYTISDVVNMVLCAGGVPVFADIEADGSFNISAASVMDILDANHDVGAVLVTHFYGLICDIDSIMRACAQRGIPVIEDAAQAFGARLGARAAGTIGHAGIFSFGLLKNVTGFFGGAVLTLDSALEGRIREELDAFGRFPRKVLARKMLTGAAFDTATFPPIFDGFVYWLFRYACLHDLSFFDNKLDTDSNPIAYSDFPRRYACRMSSAQADIIWRQFDRVEDNARARIAKAQLYHEGLKDLPEIVLPPARSDGSHVYIYYAIQHEDRDGLARSMTRRLRDVQISHHRNCAGLRCFSAFVRECPNASRAERNTLYLPTYPGYRNDQALANIEAIRAHFREANACT